MRGSRAGGLAPRGGAVPPEREEAEDVVTATADGAEAHKSLAARFGIASGQVVQEIGYDDDVDDELRSAIAAATGSELVDEDYDDVVDVVLLWWREEEIGRAHV